LGSAEKVKKCKAIKVHKQYSLVLPSIEVRMQSVGKCRGGNEVGSELLCLCIRGEKLNTVSTALHLNFYTNTASREWGGGAVLGRNFDVNIGRATYDACRSIWLMGNSSCTWESVNRTQMEVKQL
jgi:hypothetical protein